MLNMVVLTLNYRQANLRVELDSNLFARLYINGIQRDKALPDSLPASLKLTSTVQTDYEWHEFIEAEVMFTETAVKITLRANGVEQASRCYALAEIEGSHATG